MKYACTIFFFLLGFNLSLAQTSWQDYTKIGDSLQLQFQFDKVISQREKAIKLARVSQKDTIPFLELLLEISKNELVVDNPDLKNEAYKNLQSQIIKLDKSGAKPERLYQAYRRMYIIAHNFIRNMKDTDTYVSKSIEYHYKCKEIDSLVLMRTMHTSGVVSREVGRLNASVKVFKDAIEFYNQMKVKDTNVYASVHMDLAMVYNSNFLNIPSNRLKYLKKSESIFTSLSEPNMDYLISVYINLSEYERGQGNYEKAIGYLKKGFEMYKTNKAQSQKFRMGQIGVKRDLQFNQFLAEIYRETNQENLMLDHILALETVNAKHTLDDIETDFFVTGKLVVSKFYYKKDNDKALRYLNDGLKIHKNRHFETFEHEFIIHKIKIYIDQERFLEAEILFKDLESVENLPQFIEKDLLVLKASLHIKNNSKELAYNNINKLFNEFSNDNKDLDIASLDPNDFIPSLALSDTELIIDIINELDTDKFRDDKIKHRLYIIALKQFESNFNQEFLNEKLKKTYDKIGSYFYTRAANRSLTENEETLFFNFTETIEAKYLLNTFLANRSELGTTEADQLIQREQQIRSNITYLKKKNITKKSDSINQLIFEENLKLKKIDDQLKNQKLNISKLVDIEKPLQKLERFRDRYIIKFRIVNNQLFRIIFNNNDILVSKLDNYSSLKPKIEGLISELKNITIPESEMKAHSKILHNELLKDINVSTIENIHIIPDGILHYLPFELLINEDNYILNETKISYASALSFVDSPLMIENKDIKIALFAPSYSKYAPTDKQLAVRGEPYYLDGAINEVNSISKLFKNSNMYLNDQASKLSFQELSNDYSIIHLSMHSFLNDDDSELSSLVFSDNDRDYELYISELYGLNLNADMVVLSACNTGVGSLKTGKGIVSMNTAFTSAGVPSVLSSLWSAPDEATQQIMVAFYKHLKDGHNKSKALQLAKQDYLKATSNELLKHPFYWAGFVISGDISPIVTKKSNLIWIILGSFTVILLVGGIIKMRKKSAA